MWGRDRSIRRLHPTPQLPQDLLDLLQARPQIVGDLFSQEVRVGEVGGVFEALVAEPEQVEAHLVALKELVEGEGPEAPLGRGFGPGGPPLVPILGVVAVDELLEVGPGQATFLQGEVLVGAQVVDPERLGPRGSVSSSSGPTP